MKLNIVELWKKNITTKLIISVGALVVCTLLINAIVVIVLKNLEKKSLIEDKREELREDLQERSEQYATFATNEVIDIYEEYYNYSLTGKDLEEVFQDYFVQKMEDILYTNLDVLRGHVFIYSSEGFILFDSSELTEGKYRGNQQRAVNNTELLERIKMKEMTTYETNWNGEKMLDIVYPVIEQAGIGHLYTVRYLVSFKDMERRIADMEKKLDEMTRRSILLTIILTVASIILAIGIASFLGRRITQPITQLAEDATVIAGGNLDKEVEVVSEDEVGILAEKFEQMRVSLKQKIREIAKKALGLEGTLEVFGFPDLIGFICGAQMTGSLTLEGPQKSGIIYFDQGSVVHASIDDGKIVGEQAVYNFFTWSKGTFLFEAGVTQEEKTVHGHWQHLLMEGARQTDEMDVIKQLIPSSSAELSVLPQPSDAQKEIKLTPEEMNIIALIQQERVVKNILERSPQPEFDTYKIMYSLVSSGLVEVKT